MNVDLKQELTKIGYPSESWTVISPDVVKACEAFPGHQNNVYGIYQRKFAKKFDKGSKIAKIEWLEKNQIDFEEKTETIEVKAQISIEDNTKETIKEVEKIVEASGIPEDNVIIGQVPNLPSEDAKADTCRICNKQRNVEGTYLHESKEGRICNECASVIWNERIAKIEKYGYVRDKETIYTDGDSNNLETKDWGILSQEDFNPIFSRVRTRFSIKQKDTDKAQKVQDDAMERIEKKADKMADKIIAKQEEQRTPTPEAEVENKVEKQVEKSTELERKIKGTKKEPIKAETKRDILENLPKADGMTIKHFRVVTELAEVLISFKRTFYAIAQIKEILESKDTPAKKITQIKTTVENIKTHGKNN